MNATAAIINPPWTRRQWVTAGLFFIAVTLALLVRNQPWQLDNYDQAKQAYASQDMVLNGHWLFQHLPIGGYATKPPLVGWVSAGLYYITGSWDWAWRLPSLASALVLMGLLLMLGRQYAGWRGGMVAAAAVILNMLGLRLATLVRTDMPLALLIFVAGAMILRHVEQRQPWRPRDRIGLGLVILAAVLTKGHVVYAFLLPGLLAYAGYARATRQVNHAWPGWTVWIVPLAVLAAMLAAGLRWLPGFYDQIVVDELLVVFQTGAAAGRTQPVYYYLPHLLHKWVPWSLLLILMMTASRTTRGHLSADPGRVWLLAWILGGLLAMSLVPQKRVDRIFPVVPPLCLLLAMWAGHLIATARGTGWFFRTRNVWATVALLGWGGYAVYCSMESTRHHEAALEQFGRAVAARHPAGAARLAVVDPGDDGLICYLASRQLPIPADAALAQWQAGALDALIARESFYTHHAARLADGAITAAVTSPFEGVPYLYITKLDPRASGR